MERPLGHIPGSSSCSIERQRYDHLSTLDNNIDKRLIMERSTSGGRGVAPAAAENSVQKGGPLLERFRAVILREKRRQEEEEDEEEDDDFEDDHKRERPRRLVDEQIIVGVYKNALAELTFNSKPIITDLTIIAGEHSHAAKGIAATVCKHILEVPVEQKLPSLYLLDSIVKNIGGDYVKYFSARLPEVFCTSYRQVDPSSYHAMQHLFRTWGGVFPSPPLRTIEADLQFPPVVNGPSPGTTSSRPTESQAQRPGHSIHVNPKYLEARQFEQSSMAEGSNSENNEDSSSPEPERSGRSVHESPKAWSEAPRRLHHAHRLERGDDFHQTVYVQKPATRYFDYDFSLGDSLSPSRVGVGRPPSPFSRMGGGRPPSPLSRLRGGRAPTPPRFGIGRDTSPSKIGVRNAPSPSTSRIGAGRSPSPSRIGIGRLNEKIVDQGNGWERPWHGKTDGDGLRPLDTAYSQRNGYDWQQQPMHDALLDAYGNIRGQRSLRGPLSHLQPPQELDMKNTRVMSRNWKNSEEEEYMWEDMSPSLENHGRGSDNIRKGDCFVGDVNKWPGLGRGKRMGTESALPDSDWCMRGTMSHMDQPMLSGKDMLPLRRESEERHPSSLSQSGIVSWNVNTAIETSSLSKSSEGVLGHRYVPVRPPHFSHQNPSTTSQSRLKTVQASVPGCSGLSTGVASFNLAHSGGPPAGSVSNFRSVGTELQSGMLSKSPANVRSSLGSDSLNFEFLPSMMPASSNISFPMRQQPERHVSPSPIPQSVRPSIQPIPPVPSSAPLPQNSHFQLIQLQQQQNNFIKSEDLPFHSQALSSQSSKQSPRQLEPVEQVPQQLPWFQQVPQSQALPELNQLPYNVPQGSYMPQKLPVPQEVQQIPLATFSHTIQSQPLIQSQTVTQSQLSGGAPQTLGSIVSSSMANSNSGLNSVLIPPVPNNLSSQVLGRVQPPLPPGPPPASLLVASSSQVMGSVTIPQTSGSSLSSILSSLMQKGLISVTAASSAPFVSVPVTSAIMANQLSDNNATVAEASTTTSLLSILPANQCLSKAALSEAQDTQDPIGTQFSSEILRVRHESVLNALYNDLPRQCTSCGMRFRCQEEHSNHMDWHVSRNRTISKSRKQKSLQSTSRKWFMSATEWLNETENLAAEVVPAFSPVEMTLDKKDNEEFAVPVDDDQSVCVLCGELFEFFYSDETDEWMYKGTVYMNAPGGSTEGMGGSSRGAIVHAKCRSKSAGINFADSEEDELEGNDDSETRRKRYSVWYHLFCSVSFNECLL
ncbi:uncharacterized protein LOC131077999 isoform X2 [Cryptomeria japonica]|uniref:uncharacterized protein LOC131077999 isoform X2 n=1 Tax=Cryptomeria japonica TaxID=3369 RepID=UPI0027DA8E09|nr:uncharacterized protein LOC131077999 isoform X2 [Cryptomeria japonica]